MQNRYRNCNIDYKTNRLPFSGSVATRGTVQGVPDLRAFGKSGTAYIHISDVRAVPSPVSADPRRGRRYAHTGKLLYIAHRPSASGNPGGAVQRISYALMYTQGTASPQRRLAQCRTSTPLRWSGINWLNHQRGSAKPRPWFKRRERQARPRPPNVGAANGARRNDAI